MKKTLFALSALAVSAGASAQSSVTLFGLVDATLARGTGSVSSKTQLTNSGYNSSRVGFRGIEDLGGGLKAGFQYEAAVNNDNGTGGASNTNNQASGNPISGLAGGQGLTFNRRSTLSLGGAWGELRLGRDYTAQFWNLNVFDPFNTNGVGTNQMQNSNVGGVTNTRASNNVIYLWNHHFNATTAEGADGFHAMVQYFLGENASGTATSRDGSGSGVRVGYNGGPLVVAASWGRTHYAAGDITMESAGASYRFGNVKVSGVYGRDSVGSAVPVHAKGYLVGANVYLGAGEFRAAYSAYKTDAATSPQSKKFAVGYVHNLSKRTALYATYAHVGNSGNANQALNGATTAAGGRSSGLDLGVRHIF